MTNIEFANAAIEVATKYKTLYVNGCFGAPMNDSNKQRYCNNTSYNRKPERTQMIMAASSDTFGFDCICLVKGLLWGWKGDLNHQYGGAQYQSNGVPDITEEAMIAKCSDVSSDFSKIEVGEYLWMQGHAGIYVGNGLSVECTPQWQNKVQITACNRDISGYKRRNWTKHGKLPYITYISEKPYTQDQFIKDVQKILNQPQTGIANTDLLQATITISEKTNNCHPLVLPIQKWLYALGFVEVGIADGEAGPKFTQAVKNYQKTGNGYVDGEITAQQKTWKRLLNYTEHICKYESKIIKNATCTNEGVKTFTCSCGKTYTESIPKIPHLYTKKIISPTYEEKGYTLNVCQACGNTYKDNWIDPIKKEEPEIIIPEPVPQPKPQPTPPQPQSKPEPTSKEWQLGDAAKVIADTSLIGGKKILPWIFKNKVYIRDFRENEAVIISTQKAGPILGAVYLKDLLHYSNKYYDVSVTSNLLNVRETPEANSKIVNQIKKNTQYTIIEEKNGWGHIANSGWIMLQYVRKV